MASISVRSVPPRALSKVSTTNSQGEPLTANTQLPGGALTLTDPDSTIEGLRETVALMPSITEGIEERAVGASFGERTNRSARRRI